MNIIHRLNSEERQHYTLEQRYSFKAKPRLLYVGELKKSEGWAEQEHHHDFIEILFIKDGCAQIDVNGTSTVAQKGDIVIYNAATPHREQCLSDESVEMYFFALDNLSLSHLPINHLLPPEYNNIFPTASLYDTFISLFEQAIQELESQQPFHGDIVKNLARALLLYVVRVIHADKADKPVLHSNKIVEQATQYINEHYHGPITLDALAEHCFVNKYYLSHLFADQRGITLKQYIINKRLAEAKQLLLSQKASISEIAARVGFSDTSYFSRLFKREVGASPLQYRQNKEKQNKA